MYNTADHVLSKVTTANEFEIGMKREAIWAVVDAWKKRDEFNPILFELLKRYLGSLQDRQILTIIGGTNLVEELEEMCEVDANVS